MHSNFDRALGRLLKAIWRVLGMTFTSVLLMLVLGGIFTSLLYWCVLIVKLAWNQ